MKAGDKVKGFKYDSTTYYAPEMDRFIGQIGEIVEIDNDGTMLIHFNNPYYNSFWYPSKHPSIKIIKNSFKNKLK